MLGFLKSKVPPMALYPVHFEGMSQPTDKQPDTSDEPVSAADGSKPEGSKPEDANVEPPRLEVHRNLKKHRLTGAEKRERGSVGNIVEAVQSKVVETLTGTPGDANAPRASVPMRASEERKRLLRAQHEKRMKAAEKYRWIVDEYILPFAVEFAFKNQRAVIGDFNDADIQWAATMIGLEEVYCGLYVNAEEEIAGLKLPFSLAVVYNAGAHAIELALERLADGIIDRPVYASISGLVVSVGQVGVRIAREKVPLFTIGDKPGLFSPRLSAPIVAQIEAEKAQAAAKKAAEEAKTAADTSTENSNS